MNVEGLMSGIVDCASENYKYKELIKLIGPDDNSEHKVEERF